MSTGFCRRVKPENHSHSASSEPGPIACIATGVLTLSKLKPGLFLIHESKFFPNGEPPLIPSNVDQLEKARYWKYPASVPSATTAAANRYEECVSAYWTKIQVRLKPTIPT